MLKLHRILMRVAQNLMDNYLGKAKGQTMFTPPTLERGKTSRSQKYPFSGKRTCLTRSLAEGTSHQNVAEELGHGRDYVVRHAEVVAY